jgi:hypothetical protein
MAVSSVPVAAIMRCREGLVAVTDVLAGALVAAGIATWMKVADL